MVYAQKAVSSECSQKLSDVSFLSLMSWLTSSRAATGQLPMQHLQPTTSAPPQSCIILLRYPQVQQSTAFFCLTSLSGVLWIVAGMALDTQDVADYARSHTKGLRLTFWLFKTDQVPACPTTPPAMYHLHTGSFLSAAPMQHCLVQNKFGIILKLWSLLTCWPVLAQPSGLPVATQAIM